MFCAISSLHSPLERKFRANQIIFITNFIVVSGVGLKKVTYLFKPQSNRFCIDRS